MAGWNSLDELQRTIELIEKQIRSGSSVAEACRAAGISSQSYYRWRNRFNLDRDTDSIREFPIQSS